MTHGLLQIRSGHWEWRLVRRRSGTALVFQREQLGTGTMSCRLPPAAIALTEAEVRQRANDPDQRTWVDAKGMHWVIEPDRASPTEPGAEQLRYGYAYCRERTPRQKQTIWWLAPFTLGTLTDEDIKVIITVAETRRGARKWQRVADFLAEHRWF